METRELRPVMSVPGLFARVRRLGWRERLIFAEAFLALAFASFAIRLMPFRRTVLLASSFGDGQG